MSPRTSPKFASRRPTRGFTLVELAIVFLIVGLLLGFLLPSLSFQVQHQRTAEAQRLTAEIRESLMGYAAANGRLPCPASSTSAGQESFAAGGNSNNGNCSNFHGGFLPGVTLGVAPTDSQGFVVDPWGNRIRYAVTDSDSHSFTRSNGMRITTMQGLDPDLRVCDSAAGITPDRKCANPETSNTLSNKALAVVLSTGPNGVSGSHGADEAANLDADRVFVHHVPTPTGSANEFDDIVTWLSPNVLYNRLISAGQLP